MSLGSNYYISHYIQLDGYPTINLLYNMNGHILIEFTLNQLSIINNIQNHKGIHNGQMTLTL